MTRLGIQHSFSARRGLPGVSTSILLALLTLSHPAPATAQPLPPGEALVAGNAPDRLAAARVLCELGEWSRLRPALVDPAESVRRLAVACWRPEHGDLALVASLANDPSPSVRSALAPRLATSTDATAQAALRQLLGDPDEQVRGLALEHMALPEGGAALAVLSAPLADPSPEVAATAAERIDSLGLAEALPAEQRARYDAALALARLRRDAPELAAATTALQRRIATLSDAMAHSDEGPMACASGTLRAFEELAGRVTAVVRLPHGPKDPDRFELLLGLEDDLGSASQAYQTCLNATPLNFGAYSGTGLLETYGLLLLGEVDTAWEANFGLLRSDLDEPVDGGDLWVQTTLGVDLLLPRASFGEPGLGVLPTLELSGRLDRHQLFRHEPLSSWAGGGFARARLPFGCGSYRRCGLQTQLLARRSPGLDTDFPERLVAGHRQLTGDTAFELPIGDALNTLTLEVGRVRYEEAGLEAAGLDTLGARLEVDSTFQLRLEARRNLYAAAGPTNAGTPLEPNLDRDATLLAGQLGVRFGAPDPGDGLQLYVLGGMLFPLVDGIDELDPQVTFAALLVAQEGSAADVMSRLRLGGTRSAGSSPRDFALQTVSRSFIHYTFQALDLPEQGVRFDARLGHQLTQYLGPLTAETLELDVNVIEGHLGVRVILSEWIGFELADTIRAIRFRDRDFEATNRFVLALFVPFGDEAMGREEGLPW